jgi:hypothetical protein
MDDVCVLHVGVVSCFCRRSLLLVPFYLLRHDKQFWKELMGGGVSCFLLWPAVLFRLTTYSFGKVLNGSRHSRPRRRGQQRHENKKFGAPTASTMLERK